ncbi:MAG: hypothetical protein MUO17_05295 [Dehalococcoidales bacterium]|nr:hypothetical protein [Dehalococcoidales bacterium]
MPMCEKPKRGFTSPSPAATMTFKVDNFNNYMKGYVERIRNLIPKEALEEESKALEYGSQQSLI